MKHFQLTFNNGDNFGYDFDSLHDVDICPTPHLENIMSIVRDVIQNNFGCNFVALSMEKGSHVHIHVYVQMTYKPQSFKAWQKMFPGVHVEDCRGTPKENMDYIAKSGKWEDDVKHGTLRWGPLTYGEMLNSGKGGPDEYIKLINAGKSYWDVLSIYPEALRDCAYGINKAIESRSGNVQTTTH